MYNGVRVGRDSAVGIATRYGLDVRGSTPGRDEIFRSRPDRPWGSPSLLYNGYRVIPGGKAAWTWRWPPTPIDRRGYRKGTAIPLLPLWAFMACSRENFTITFTMELEAPDHVSDSGYYNTAILHSTQSLGGSTRSRCEIHGERNLLQEQLLPSHMPNVCNTFRWNGGQLCGSVKEHV
jgi:hypothetical protein